MKKVFAVMAMWLVGICPAMSQGSSEVAKIRQSYAEAKRYIEINDKTDDPGTREDMEVTAHYIIPACGPTVDVIRYYFNLHYNEDLDLYSKDPYFITRRYNVAARKVYREYLFDKAGNLIFAYHKEDQIEGPALEMRYYFKDGELIHFIGKSKETPEDFVLREATELLNGFNTLMNRETL